MGLKLSDAEISKEDIKLLGGIPQDDEWNDNASQDDAWNNDIPQEDTWANNVSQDYIDVKSYSVKDTIDPGEYYFGDEHIPQVLKVCKLLIYLTFVIAIFLELWVCTKPSVDWLYNTMTISGPVCMFVFMSLIDAIIAKTRGRAWWLILIALFFPVLYPIVRNKHIDRSFGLSILFVVGYLASSITLCGFGINATTQYGIGVICNTDEETRKETAKMLDQKASNGKRLGDCLESEMLIGDISIQKEGINTYLIIDGYGSTDFDGSSFETVSTYSVLTRMVFMQSSSGMYQLYGVNLNDKTFTSSMANQYWEYAMLQ